MEAEQRPRIVVVDSQVEGRTEVARTIAACTQPAVPVVQPEQLDPAEADVAIVLDAPSLERARGAGIPVVVTATPSFHPADHAVAGADRVLVPHGSVAEGLALERTDGAEGVPVGPIAPVGYGPLDPDRRAEAREQAGLPAESPVMVVSPSVIEAHGPNAVLVQLGLVSGPVTCLFDVAEDVQLAETLRRELPGHDLPAYLFARGPQAPHWWALADLAVAPARGLDAYRALASGASVVVVCDGPSDEPAGESLRATGAARMVDRCAMLAVELDAALEPSMLHGARSAARELDAEGGAQRVLDAARDAWEDHRARGGIPRGLPQGLEPVGALGAQQDPGEPRPRPDADLDDQVERELEALKRRL